MFNMFVVALVLLGRIDILKTIYFAADTATPKPEADLLYLILRNRDIVYSFFILHSPSAVIL